MHSRFSFLAEQLQFFSRPIIILDLEATGGNLHRDRITEIAFLYIENNKIKKYQYLINPEQEISPYVSKLTGIDNNMLQQAPTFAKILPNLKILLKNNLLIAHNSQFDYTLLAHEFRRLNISFNTLALCSVQLSKSLYSHELKHNLDAIAQRFHIPIYTGQRHRALTDVLILTEFLQASLCEHKQIWFQTARKLIRYLHEK